MSSSPSGFFVTFEGIDGSGKSTQIEMARDFLSGLGYPVVVTRNPGGTHLGLGIREILLHHPGHVAPRCELMLYMADRAQHMDEIILPALSQGAVVLCDRHLDSTIAYQGYGRGIDLSLIHQLNQVATSGRGPDLTILLDGPAEILASRVAKRGEADRLERESLMFREKVREGYLALAHSHPHRFHTVDATQSIEAMASAIQKILSQFIKARKP
ncbi:MAG: dTMP kinase [Cyanobacteria bacterium]|nr:dTMP kinase [Cyanobacteriota bacterium]